MKNSRRKGVALILAIIAMAIIGLEMHVLSSGSSTMLFQSDRAYLEACKRNLITSGLAWAKRNIQNNSTETFEKSISVLSNFLQFRCVGVSDPRIGLFIFI